MEREMSWMVRHILLLFLFLLILITAEWRALEKMGLHTDSKLTWLDDTTL
jgi:hypothetical protein